MGGEATDEPMGYFSMNSGNGEWCDADQSLSHIRN